MGLIISSKSQALRHGAYIIEKVPPAVIQAAGTNVACIVAQLPWGPEQEIVTPSSVGERLITFCPPGMDRTVSGYLAMTQKAFPILKVVRVTDTATSAKATATVTKSGPTNMLTLTAKYVGDAGNDLTWEVYAATDGDSNHFNLKVSVVGASGTTEDILQNLNYSGTGADSTPSFTNLRLLGGITKLAAGVPLTGTGTFSGGDDGTITSAEYVGTEGTGNKGLALLEGDPSIRHVFFDDPGDSIRPACNAGMKAHVDYMGDRLGYINGDSGQTVTEAQTDVDNYRSINLVYCDPWCYMFDDVDGTERLTVTAPFAASLGAVLSPSTSIAWKSPEATKFLNAITKLEADRGEAAALNTEDGISTFVKEPNGGFSIEAGVVTIAPIEPSKKYDTRTRMLHFIGKSLVSSVRPFTDGPNTTDNQQNIIEACERFLDTLKRNKDRDSNHLAHVLDFLIEDIESANDDVSLAAGEFSLPISIRLSAPMAKIFFLLNIGATVEIRNLG